MLTYKKETDDTLELPDINTILTAEQQQTQIWPSLLLACKTKVDDDQMVRVISATGEYKDEYGPWGEIKFRYDIFFGSQIGMSLNPETGEYEELWSQMDGGIFTIQNDPYYIVIEDED